MARLALALCWAAIVLLTLEQTHGAPDRKPGKNGDQIQGEDDIVLTKRQRRVINRWRKQNERQTQSVGIANTAFRWPSQTMPYQFDSAISTAERNLILSAMTAWSDQTCIEFSPATSGNRVYIQKANSGCWSYVGNIRSGSQGLNLQAGTSATCMQIGVIIHEIGHALGLYHEQNRPDRDTYVTINFNNIQSGLASQFEKVPSSQAIVEGSYDYNSIMHYGDFDFSSNGQRTITTINSAFQNVIGQRSSLSTGDAATINRMYNCPCTANCYSAWGTCTQTSPGVCQQTRTFLSSSNCSSTCSSSGTSRSCTCPTTNTCTNCYSAWGTCTGTGTCTQTRTFLSQNCVASCDTWAHSRTCTCPATNTCNNCYSAWGTCTASSGSCGCTQTRTFLTQNCASSCNTGPVSQSCTCPARNTCSNCYSAWGTCTGTGTCTQTRTFCSANCVSSCDTWAKSRSCTCAGGIDRTTCTNCYSAWGTCTQTSPGVCTQSRTFSLTNCVQSCDTWAHSRSCTCPSNQNAASTDTENASGCIPTDATCEGWIDDSQDCDPGQVYCTTSGTGFGCRIRGGQCRSACRRNERAVTENTGCAATCCIPKKAKMNKRCINRGGKCRKNCDGGFFDDSKLCKGKSKNCCYV